MSGYQAGFSRLGAGCSCLNTPQAAITFATIIGLLIIEVLEKEQLEDVGNVVLTIGQILVTAAEFM